MKRIFCILMSFVMLLCFSGCNNNNDDEYSSADVEVIIQEITENVNSQGDDTVPSNDSSLQTSNPSLQTDSQVGTTSDSPVSSSTSSSEQVQENICKLNDENVLKNIKLNGRCEKTFSGIGLNLTASAIEFNTDSNNVLLELSADEGVYYSIFVDGALVSERGVTESGTNYIALARGLSDGTHNIKFVRETEARGGNTMTAINLQLDDGKSILAKDADKPLVEFLGDSLTNGYGNLTEKSTTKASDLKYQNSLKAYPYLMASSLGLDYRIVAYSGIALKAREGKYPAFYDFYSAENYHTDKSAPYSSSSSQDVDIVVVNLGTNDASSNMLKANDSVSVEEYAGLYTELITKIGYRKDTKIVFVSGISWCHAQEAAYKAAKTKLESLGYSSVYTIDVLSYQSGGENHPSAKEHQTIADTLIKFFKDNRIA